MFDRLRFDKTRFDREVKESTLANMDLEIFSVSSELIIEPVVIVPFNNDGISSNSDIKPYPLVLETNNTISFDDNDGGFYGKVPGGEFKLILVLPLTIRLGNVSRFELLRLGDTNINIIELTDFNLLPGQSITIDTDLMVVLFGLEHDVSHITDDSVFFQLDDGRNELIFEYSFSTPPLIVDTEHLNVSVLWQNRWL